MDLTVRAGPSMFLDKNRRDIVKSQSKWTRCREREKQARVSLETAGTEGRQARQEAAELAEEAGVAAAEAAAEATRRRRWEKLPLFCVGWVAAPQALRARRVNRRRARLQPATRAARSLQLTGSAPLGRVFGRAAEEAQQVLQQAEAAARAARLARELAGAQVSAPIGAPCMQRLRHGDPTHAKKGPFFGTGAAASPAPTPTPAPSRHHGAQAFQRLLPPLRTAAQRLSCR
jgi:hypothetical protein